MKKLSATLHLEGFARGSGCDKIPDYDMLEITVIETQLTSIRESIFIKFVAFKFACETHTPCSGKESSRAYGWIKKNVGRMFCHP